MKLELNIDGEKKVFTTGFVSGSFFRRLLEFDEKINYAEITLDETDELVGFVCEVFGNQFTIEEFYEGIPSHEVVSTISDVFVFVRTGKTVDELEEEEEVGN